MGTSNCVTKVVGHVESALEVWDFTFLMRNKTQFGSRERRLRAAQKRRRLTQVAARVGLVVVRTAALR